MISIAVCDDNEITAQEISEKVKQCCPIEAEVSVFYHIKDILFSIHNENKLFDIIFMDPPYQLNAEKEMLTAIADSKIADEDTQIIIEATLDREFSQDELVCFDVVRVKEYKTNKHIFLQKSSLVKFIAHSLSASCTTGALGNQPPL